MPNHVENIISLSGSEQEIQQMLKRIKSDMFGVGTVDFEKIIPMPESLNIESGTRTDRGLRAYRDFIEVYTFGRSAKDALKALEDIPEKSEEIFLRQRTDIRRDEWELGKTAWNNLRQYGAPTWYDWCIENWGTKWNAYGYDEGVDYSGNDALCFQTAWAAPHPILEKLSEMFPAVTFSKIGRMRISAITAADAAIPAESGRRNMSLKARRKPSNLPAVYGTAILLIWI